MCENKRNFAAIRKQFLRHLSVNDNVTSLSKSFGALDSNFERANFVIDLLKASGVAVEFQKDCKSDEAAIKLREEGNEMYKIKKVKEAWELYTKSICLAEENSVNLGLAYANRSAVLFEVNLHKQCLADIKRALDHNYPEHLKSKLFVREKNSKNLEVEAFRNAHEELPTVPDKNPKIQCGSTALKVQEDENFGRFVTAARDIKAGEILAVEQPFALLLVNQYLSHCHECITLCYNLLPCKTCTHALYCSENCRDQAFEKYHKYECPILGTLRFLELDKLKLLPLKIAFLVRDQYKEIKNWVEYSSEVYKSDRYWEIHNLVTNASKRSIPDLFERATVAAVLFELVKNHTDFLNDTNERLFKEILLLHMQTGPSNFHEISELTPNSSGTYEPEEIASGAFSFLSLLNHSCCPNVTRFCYGSSLVLRAIQNISKGEQCFDNYGYHHAVMSKTERRKHLQSQYYFDCICQACENDWQLYDTLPSITEDGIDETLLSKLWLGDVEAAESVLQESLVILGDLQKSQPCRNFCQVQEAVKQCFAVFGNKRRIF